MSALIIDDFLPASRIDDLRAEAVTLPYYDIRFGGARYNRLHIRSNDELKPELEAALGFPIDQQHTFFRRNLAGELAKDEVHQDTEVSQFVAILYLNRPEHCRGGTALFRHRATGRDLYPSEHEIRKAGKSPKRELEKFEADWHRKEAWEQTRLLEMKYNRLVAYPCAAFHARFPREAFGTTPDDARTIWLSFFDRV